MEGNDTKQWYDITHYSGPVLAQLKLMYNYKLAYEQLL